MWSEWKKFGKSPLSITGDPFGLYCGLKFDVTNYDKVTVKGSLNIYGGSYMSISIDGIEKAKYTNSNTGTTIDQVFDVSNATDFYFQSRDGDAWLTGSIVFE